MTIASPWIDATGQRWKLVVLLALTVVAISMVLGGIFPAMGQVVIADRSLYSAAAPLVGAVWLGWFAFAVRCPHCGARPGLWYLRNKGLTEWFTGFVGAVQCPTCGHSGSLDE